jgi:hypothetical protein
MMMGVLGSLVYTSTSLVSHFCEGDFESDWTLWYLLHPLRGSSLAVVFYVLLRGGLFNISAGATALNLYGVAAVSGMVGLSSKEAIRKLKEIFTTLFEGTPSTTTEDKVPVH